MRGNVTLVATLSTIVAITGWMDANLGWPFAQFALRETLSSDLIRSIPLKYARLAVHLGEAVLFVQGAIHVTRLWRHGTHLSSAMALALLVGAFAFVRSFLDEFLLVGGADMVSQQLAPTDIRFWLQVALYGGVPTLLRGTALDFIKSLTPLPQKTAQATR